MPSSLFEFPNPVNHLAARLVASGVIVMSAIAIVARQPWLSALIAYGFIARSLSGPRFSPLARVAVFLAPRLHREPRLVPGPPKRFAQTMGACFSVTAMGFWLSGSNLGCDVVLGILLVPALLEAGLGYCLGCEIFAFAMGKGLIPESVCEECANIYKAQREGLA